MQETPKPDAVARDVAEAVFRAYEIQAASRIHPANGQTLITRLVEAIRPEIDASADAIVAAANAVLEAWEQINDDVRGPRIASLSLPDGAVTMTLPDRLV